MPKLEVGDIVRVGANAIYLPYDMRGRLAIVRDYGNDILGALCQFCTQAGINGHNGNGLATPDVKLTGNSSWWIPNEDLIQLAPNRFHDDQKGDKNV